MPSFRISNFPYRTGCLVHCTGCRALWSPSLIGALLRLHPSFPPKPPKAMPSGFQKLSVWNEDLTDLKCLYIFYVYQVLHSHNLFGCLLERTWRKAHQVPHPLLQIRKHGISRGLWLQGQVTGESGLEPPNPKPCLPQLWGPSPLLWSLSTLHSLCCHYTHIHPTGPGVLSSRSSGTCASTTHDKDDSGAGALLEASYVKMSSHIGNCLYLYSYLLQDGAQRR